MSPVLELRGVSKSYGLNPVLEELSLQVGRGEILALVGENGAGKSTLMRIAGGYAAPSSGEAFIEDVSTPRSVQAAEDLGAVLVHQEFCLAPDLTVAENIFVGREPKRRFLVDYPRMNADAVTQLGALGSTIEPTRKLAGLPNTEWQMVEIAKAFARAPKVLLMDEPTAVLGAREVEALFRRMRQFAAEGGSIVFTSHRLDEVKAIATTVAVLRDGRIRHLGPSADLTEDEMAALMVGRELSQLFPPKAVSASGETILAVEDLSSAPLVNNVSFELRKGEILGVAGLVGSGRTEMFETLVGLREGTCRRFRFANLPEGHLPSARQAWDAGLAYLSEDRKGKGLLLDAKLAENVSLTVTALNGEVWAKPAEDEKRLHDAIERFDIRAGDPGVTARSLSGGNQPVKQAKAAGVFITTVDRGLSEEGIEDLYVGGNNPQYGVIAAKYFKDKFPDGAKIVVMRGIPTTIDNVRIEAFQKELDGSKVEVLDMQFANWNPDKGFEVMQDFLQKFDTIDAVWAGDDDAALGAIEAINQAKRDKPIAVLGGSGMNKVIKMIQDSGDAIDADIFYPPTLIVPAIELTAMRAATQAPVRGRYILDSPLITKDNASEFYFPDAPY